MFRLSQGLISCRHIEIKLNQYISNLLVVLYWWCGPTEVSLWLVVCSVLIGVVKNELVIYNFSLTCCRTCDSFTDCTNCGCLDLVAINTLLLTLLKKNSFFFFCKGTVRVLLRYIGGIYWSRLLVTSCVIRYQMSLNRGKKESIGIKTGIKSDARIKSSCYLSSVFTNFIYSCCRMSQVLSFCV